MSIIGLRVNTVIFYSEWGKKQLNYSISHLKIIH